MNAVPPAEDPTHSAEAKARRGRRRAITLGLIALPVVGSAFVLPAIANAQPTAVSTAAVVRPDTDQPDTTPPAVKAAVAKEVAAKKAAAGASVKPGTEKPGADDTFVQAYLDAGYSFDDAVVLSQLWGTGKDFYQAKVKAGTFLEHGTPLEASPSADRTAADGYTDAQLTDLFLGSGYSLKDATVLADKWGVGVGEAKALAGRELKVVGVLPFVDPSEFASSGEEAAFGAFFDAGYGYDDAVLLAKSWGLGQPADAKVKAGNLLLAHKPLPAVPGVGN